MPKPGAGARKAHKPNSPLAPGWYFSGARSVSGGETQEYDGDGHGRRSGSVEAFPQVARATGPWNMVHHCQPSTGLYHLSPYICATHLASACIPVPRNTRHTCPTQHPNYCHPQMASARAQITNNKYATCMAGPHACKSRKSGASAGLAVRVALLQASALRMVPLPHDNH